MTVRALSGADQPANERGAIPDHRRFPNLDGLRAIAAMAVLTFHVSSTLSALGEGWKAPTAFFRFGSFGVSVFFVLSGFLLFRPFVVARFSGDVAPEPIAFWIRRAARIFPAYWVALTVALLVLPAAHSSKSLGDLLTMYPLLQTYRGRFAFEGLGVEWTLVIEVAFYLLLPAIAWALSRATRRLVAPNRIARAYVAALIVLSGGSLAFYWWSVSSLFPLAARGAWLPFAQGRLWIASYLDWFALGMLLAVGSAWTSRGGQLPPGVRLLAAMPWISWALAGAAFAAVLQFGMPTVAFDEGSPIQMLALKIGMGWTAFFLVLPAVLGDQRSGWSRQALSLRPLAAIGAVSYGIYLWHIIVVGLLRKYTLAGIVPAQFRVWWPTTVAISVVLGTVSYWAVERPAMRWSHRVTHASQVDSATRRIRVSAAHSPGTDAPGGA